MRLGNTTVEKGEKLVMEEKQNKTKHVVSLIAQIGMMAQER